MTQPHTLQPKEIPPQQTLLQMASGYWVSQAIYVAAKLGIADFLQAEAKHCDELATLTGTDARTLYRLMRALANLGIFAEGEAGYFQLTPLAACLKSQASNSVRSLVIMRGEGPNLVGVCPGGHRVGIADSGVRLFSLEKLASGGPGRPIEMSGFALGLLSFPVLVGLVALRIPIAVAMLVVGGGYVMLSGWLLLIN